MRTTFLLLLLVGTLAPHASAQSAPGPRPDQECTALEYTEPPRSVGTLVDSVAFVDALRRFSGGNAGIPLISVSVDKNGRPERVEGYLGSAAVRDARTFQRALLPHVRNQPTTERGTTYRFAFTPEGAGSLNLLRFERGCAPVLLNLKEVTNLTVTAYERVSRKRGGRAPERLQRALVMVRIDERGVPVDVRLERGTGDPDMDRELRGVARKTRFAPAMLDEFPVSVWVQVPMNVIVQ
jgi:TonB family protein